MVSQDAMHLGAGIRVRCKLLGMCLWSSPFPRFAMALDMTALPFAPRFAMALDTTALPFALPCHGRRGECYLQAGSQATASEIWRTTIVVFALFCCDDYLLWGLGWVAG